MCINLIHTFARKLNIGGNLSLAIYSSNKLLSIFTDSLRGKCTINRALFIENNTRDIYCQIGNELYPTMLISLIKDSCRYVKVQHMLTVHYLVLTQVPFPSL